jgi:hypothetical protein
LRYIVRVGYSLPEDEGRDPAILATFPTLQEAEDFAREQLEEHGPAWGATRITKEEEV